MWYQEINIIILPGEFGGTAAGGQVEEVEEVRPTSAQRYVRLMYAGGGIHEEIPPLKAVHQKPASENQRNIILRKGWPR